MTKRMEQDVKNSKQRDKINKYMKELKEKQTKECMYLFPSILNFVYT